MHDHRSHIRMHVGLLAAILALVMLRSAGVGVPTWAAYMVLLACPLMMVWMLFGMNQGSKAVSEADGSRQPEHHDAR